LDELVAKFINDGLKKVSISFASLW